VEEWRIWPSQRSKAQFTFGTPRREKNQSEVSQSSSRCLTNFSRFSASEPNRIDLEVHENGIFDLQWSHDDTTIATCSGDHTTRITDVSTGKVLHLLRGHSSTVKTVVWDPLHTSLLSTGGRDGGIRVWDLRIAERDAHGPTSHASVTVIDSAHGEDSRTNRGGRKKIAPTARTVTSLVYAEGRSDRLISSGSFDG